MTVSGRRLQGDGQLPSWTLLQFRQAEANSQRPGRGGHTRVSDVVRGATLLRWTGQEAVSRSPGPLTPEGRGKFSVAELCSR